MNRRSFLLGFAGLVSFGGLISLAFRSVFGSERITDCRDCPNDWACCKALKGNTELFLPVSEYEKEILIREGKKRNIEMGYFEVWENGLEDFFWHTEALVCPLLLMNQCAIHGKHPGVCQKHFCKVWGFTDAQQDSINQKVDREWDRGKNAK